MEQNPCYQARPPVGLPTTSRIKGRLFSGYPKLLHRVLVFLPALVSPVYRSPACEVR